MRIKDLFRTRGNHADSLIQFLKFGLVGVMNTLISLACYYSILAMDSDLYLVGHVVGFLVSVTNAFFWNERYVFQNAFGSKRVLFLKCITSYGCTLLLGTGFLYLLVNHLAVSQRIAPLINLLLTIPLNFFLNKHWVFQKKPEGKQEK